MLNDGGKFSAQLFVPSALFVVLLHAGNRWHNSGLIEQALDYVVVLITNALCLLLFPEVTVVMLAMKQTRGVIFLPGICFNQLDEKPAIFVSHLRRKPFLYFLLASSQSFEIPFLLQSLSLGGRCSRCLNFGDLIEMKVEGTFVHVYVCQLALPLRIKHPIKISQPFEYQ